MRLPRAGVLLAILAGACVPPERTTQIDIIDQRQGYRYPRLEQMARKHLSDAFVVVSFSGGGTRAAALSMGALQALQATIVETPAGAEPLADNIDLISSVSGGSVTAAYYALEGQEGLPKFEKSFLKHDVQGALLGTFLAPWTLARLATPSYARIDILRDYLDAHVYEGATYQSVLDKIAEGKRWRPYVVINAGDMTTGAVFSFTQDQFDLMCSDLSKLALADAVTASAAFPLAFTALTLKNHSPCPAQAEAVKQEGKGWISVDGHPRPVYVNNDAKEQDLNPARFRRGRNALTYLNENGRTLYVQLEDGGVSDNVGLTEPLTLVTSTNRSPSIRSRINRHEINRLIFIVVNARSEPDTSYSTSSTPPGIIDTILTTMGSPIDSTSFLLLDDLEATVQRPSDLKKTIVPVDFDYLADPECQRRFRNLSTSWQLKDGQIDALVALGDAMIRESPSFRRLVDELGGRIEAGPTIKQACDILQAVGS